MAASLNLFVMDAFPEQMSWRDFATAMSRSVSRFDKINDHDKYIKSAEWRQHYWQKMSDAHEADYTHSLNLGEPAHPYYKEMKQYYKDVIRTTGNNAIVIRELDADEVKKNAMENYSSNLAQVPPNVVMANGMAKNIALLKRDILIRKGGILIAKIQIAVTNIRALKEEGRGNLLCAMLSEIATTKCIDLMRGPYFNDNKIRFYVEESKQTLRLLMESGNRVRDAIVRADESIEDVAVASEAESEARIAFEAPGDTTRTAAIETVERATQLHGGTKKRATARSRKYKNKTRVSRK